MGASGMVWCGLDERPDFALRREWMRHREIEFSVEPASKRDDVWVLAALNWRRGPNRKDRGEAEAFGDPTGPIHYRPGATETECAPATRHRQQQCQGIAPPGRSRAEAELDHILGKQ